jgi:hypothetical protein
MSALSKRLFAVLADKYPECRVPPSAAFWPMASLDSGDLSTTAAIEIAKITKHHAEKVAHELIDSLADGSQIEWRSDKGYIVCSQLPMPVIISEVQETVRAALDTVRIGTTYAQSPITQYPPKQAPLSIWCLLPDNTEPVYARLRLLARCSLQALLAVTYGERVRLCFNPLTSTDADSPQGVLDCFRKAVEWIINHESEQRLDVQIPSSDTGHVIWTTHHYHERLSDNVKKSLSQMRRAGLLQVTMPADGWLLSRDRALSEILSAKAVRRVIDRIAEMESQGRDGWRRLLFHLASSTPSGDFDPAVALFDECASPLWSMKSLVSRFQRFKGAVPRLISKPELVQSIWEVEPYRKLVLSALFLSVYTARAILHNEIEAWCGAFERLAQEGHRFINTPSTRNYLEKMGGTDSCMQIAAGLGFGLSCIVALVMEERCADQ